MDIILNFIKTILWIVAIMKKFFKKIKKYFYNVNVKNAKKKIRI